MRIVVSGSTGLIGSHLIPRLVEDGHYVVGLTSRSVDTISSEHHACDVVSEQAIEVATQGDVIVHLAGLADASSSVREPVRYNRVNALGTLHMLEAARRANAAFVLASTQRLFRPQSMPIDEATRPAPVDPYGYSKLVAEEWVHMYQTLYGLHATILRFFSVYGPGQEIAPGAASGVVTIFLRQALAQGTLEVNNQQRRDFTFAGDAAEGIRLAIRQPCAWGKTYNIATGVATSLLELAFLIKEVTGSCSRVVGPGEQGEGQNFVADISRAQSELGYQTNVQLADGIRLYAKWLQERGPSAAEGTPHQSSA